VPGEYWSIRPLQQFRTLPNSGTYERIDFSGFGSALTVNLVHDGTDTEFTQGNRTVILQGVTAGKLVTHNFVSVTALTNTVASISADSPARRSGCGHHRRARRQRHHRRQ
jgi:hypothetical protein